MLSSINTFTNVHIHRWQVSTGISCILVKIYLKSAQFITPALYWLLNNALIGTTKWISAIKNIYTETYCMYLHIWSYNTHNKQIFVGHMEHIHQCFWTGNTIQYKHACFTGTVLGGAHSKMWQFYSYTPAYQSKITSCYVGIHSKYRN